MENFLCYFVCILLFFLKGSWSRIEPNMNMQRLLSNVHNMTEWCELAGMHPDDCQKLIDDANPDEATDESGGKVVVSGVDKGDIDIAQFDGCNVRVETVYLPEHPVHDYVVWPPCTRLKRCGGCTTSKSLVCEPTEVQETFLKVFDAVLPYAGAHRFDIIGVRVVKLLEHVACEAQCRVKAHDCNEHQKYDSYQCSCICTDEIRELRGPCPDSHVWDESKCDCVCKNKNTHTCQSPAYFHPGKCRCTLKTSVSGDIDIDKLIEDLKKGLLHSGNVILNNTEAEPDLVSGKDEVKEDQNTTSLKQADKTAEVAKIDVIEESINQTSVELTEEKSPLTIPVTKSTTLRTTKTTRKRTTPLPATTTTEKPCKDTVCFGAWKPKLQKGGKCICVPPHVAST